MDPFTTTAQNWQFSRFCHTCFMYLNISQKEAIKNVVIFLHNHNAIILPNEVNNNFIVSFSNEFIFTFP